MAKAGVAKSESKYGVHPGVAMAQKWVAELKEKTGRSRDEWTGLLRKEGPSSHRERVKWLKAKHKLGHNSAWGIVERTDETVGTTIAPEAYLKAAVGYVEEQYAGPKEKLRPLYDKLLAIGKPSGADAQACPCRTMVPLYRNHVFAPIKPTTNRRIDLGFALAEYKGKLPKRLVGSGGLAKKDRITHRIEIKSASDLNDDVKTWLKIAYDLDA
jgi:hypothetical protein